MPTPNCRAAAPSPSVRACRRFPSRRREVHGKDHDAKKPVEMSPEAQAAEVSRELFGPDPSYADKPYDVEAQLAIYGNKRAVSRPAPAD